MTLYEKITSMSRDELAGYLCSLFPECEAVDNRCPGYDYCSRGHNGLRAMLDMPAPPVKTEEV